MNDHQLLTAALLEKFLRTKSEECLKKIKLLNPEILPHWHHRMVLDQSRYDFYQKEKACLKQTAPRVGTKTGGLYNLDHS